MKKSNIRVEGKIRNHFSAYIYIYIYVCVCVCVCVIFSDNSINLVWILPMSAVIGFTTPLVLGCGRSLMSKVTNHDLQGLNSLENNTKLINS